MCFAYGRVPSSALCSSKVFSSREDFWCSPLCSSVSSVVEVLTLLFSVSLRLRGAGWAPLVAACRAVVKVLVVALPRCGWLSYAIWDSINS